MVASSVTIVTLPDGVLLTDAIDQPQFIVSWTGGVGPFNVEWTIDDDPTLSNGNGNRQTATHNSVTSPDTFTPGSVLADTSPGTVWYVRANVVDTGDSNNALADDHDFTYFSPNPAERSWLYLNKNVGAAFDPTDDPGDWGVSEGGTQGADGATIDFARYLYLNANVGAGFKDTDQPPGGWGTGGNPDGGDGDEITFDRFLYLNANVDATQPCPFLFRLSSQIVNQGTSLTVYGQGLVSASSPTVDAWDAEVRLYETTDLSGTYQVLAITDWQSGVTEDSITVTIPSNAVSGWVAVVHTTGATCDGSNFIGVTIIQVEADAQAGWWVEVWNLRNSQRIISALPDVAEADIEHIPGDIGKGHLLLPANHEDIPDILDRANNIQRLVKVYQHNRFAYSFIPDDIDEDYSEDGARLARLYGEGQERMLKWGRALFKDFPSSITRTRTRLYGSTDNLLEWLFGEPDSILDDGGFEAGVEGSGQVVGTATDHLVLSPVRSGQFSLRIDPAALDDGYEWELPVQASIRLYADVYIRDQNTHDKTYTLELIDSDDNVQDSATLSPGSSTYLPINVEAIPTASDTWRLRVTQTAGTLDSFFLDDAAIYQPTGGTFTRARIAPPMLSREYVAGGLHSIELQIEDSPLLRQIVLFAPAQGNQDYTLTLNVSGPVGEEVHFSLRAGDVYDTETHTFTGLGTFDNIQLSATAGAEETVVRLAITAVSAGAFSIFIDDTTLIPGLPAANAGEITLDSIEPMQARGTLDFVTVSFSTTHDSSGQTWPETHEFEVSPEWTLWDLLDKFQGLGYRVLFAPADWRGGGDTGWELSLFAPGNSVIDHSQTLDGPAILPGDTIETARPSSAAPLETVVYGEGPGGLWSVAELDAATLTALERREGFISNQAARSATTVFRAAAHRLSTVSQRGESFVASLTDAGDPLPYFDFLPEDALRAHLPGNESRDHVPDATYRAAAVLSKLSGSGRVMSWQVDFGNYALYQQRIANLIVSRMLEREASENYRPGAGSVSSRGASGSGSSSASVSGIVAPHTHVQGDIIPIIGETPEIPEILDDLEDVSIGSPVEGDMVYRNDSGLWVAVGGTKDDGDVPTIQSDGTVAWELPAGGGGGGAAPDPIADIFGAADNAFEFDTSSLTGLTAFAQAADAEDADTTTPDHYYVRRNGSGTYRWVGRYLSAPSAPFTVIVAINAMPQSDHNKAGLFIGETTPGNMDVLCLAHSSGTRRFQLERVTPTAFGSVVTSYHNWPPGTVWLAIRVNSSTNVDYLSSTNGYIWRAGTTARNPSITIGSVGMAINPDNGSVAQAAAYDFLRIWNSALSFPGA